jgi:hypothetical protein
MCEQTVMAKPAPLDIGKALLDPAAAFDAPESVAAHDALSKAQKIEILQRWAYDESEDAVAVEEGMPGGADGNLLQRILLALDGLTGGVDVEHVGPTKNHGLPRAK